MPFPNRIVRGLKAIHTHSGRPDWVIIPYRDYTVVTTLERENPGMRPSEPIYSHGLKPSIPGSNSLNAKKPRSCIGWVSAPAVSSLKTRCQNSEPLRFQSEAGELLSLEVML